MSLGKWIGDGGGGPLGDDLGVGLYRSHSIDNPAETVAFHFISSAILV